MFKKALPALLLGLALTAGCESLGLGGDTENNNDGSVPPRRDRVSQKDRDRGGYDGTAMKYPADFDHGIPSGAHLAREIDTNGSVSYKAPHEAKLYMYDVDARRVIWSGVVRDGERFRFDSRDGKASVGDQSIMNNRDLNPDHQYRLYTVDNRDSSLDSSSPSSDRLNDRSTNDDLR